MRGPPVVLRLLRHRWHRCLKSALFYRAGAHLTAKYLRTVHTERLMRCPIGVRRNRYLNDVGTGGTLLPWNHCALSQEWRSCSSMNWASSDTFQSDGEKPALHTLPTQRCSPAALHGASNDLGNNNDDASAASTAAGGVGSTQPMPFSPQPASPIQSLLTLSSKQHRGTASGSAHPNDEDVEMDYGRLRKRGALRKRDRNHRSKATGSAMGSRSELNRIRESHSNVVGPGGNSRDSRSSNSEGRQVGPSVLRTSLGILDAYIARKKDERLMGKGRGAGVQNVAKKEERVEGNIMDDARASHNARPAGSAASVTSDPRERVSQAPSVVDLLRPTIAAHSRESGGGAQGSPARSPFLSLSSSVSSSLTSSTTQSLSSTVSSKAKVSLSLVSKLLRRVVEEKCIAFDAFPPSHPVNYMEAMVHREMLSRSFLSDYRTLSEPMLRQLPGQQNQIAQRGEGDQNKKTFKKEEKGKGGEGNVPLSDAMGGSCVANSGSQGGVACWLVMGGTGSGKSSLVPLFILYAHWERIRERLSASVEKLTEGVHVSSEKGCRDEASGELGSKTGSTSSSPTGSRSVSMGSPSSREPFDLTSVHSFVSEYQSAQRVCIVVSQPTRLACVQLAKYVAQLLDDLHANASPSTTPTPAFGARVGYAVSGDTHFSATTTEIVFATPGYILSVLQSRNLSGQKCCPRQDSIQQPNPMGKVTDCARTVSKSSSSRNNKRCSGGGDEWGGERHGTVCEGQGNEWSGALNPTALIVDEAHCRDLETDLLLAWVKQYRLHASTEYTTIGCSISGNRATNVRDEGAVDDVDSCRGKRCKTTTSSQSFSCCLRHLCVMSATMDVNVLQRYLSWAEIVNDGGEGRREVGSSEDARGTTAPQDCNARFGSRRVFLGHCSVVNVSSAPGMRTPFDTQDVPKWPQLTVGSKLDEAAASSSSSSPKWDGELRRRRLIVEEYYIDDLFQRLQETRVLVKDLSVHSAESSAIATASVASASSFSPSSGKAVRSSSGKSNRELAPLFSVHHGKALCDSLEWLFSFSRSGFAIHLPQSRALAELTLYLMRSLPRQHTGPQDNRDRGGAETVWGTGGTEVLSECKMQQGKESGNNVTVYRSTVRVYPKTILVFLPGYAEMTAVMQSLEALSLSLKKTTSQQPQTQRMQSQTLEPQQLGTGRTRNMVVGSGVGRNTGAVSTDSDSGRAWHAVTDGADMSEPLSYGECHYHIALLHSSAVGDLTGQLLRSEALPYRVVLATNVAQSSITIPNVVAVIDTCTERRWMADPVTGVTSSCTSIVSYSGLLQRRGRTGRTCDGVVIHLMPRRLVPSATALLPFASTNTTTVTTGASTTNDATTSAAASYTSSSSPSASTLPHLPLYDPPQTLLENAASIILRIKALFPMTSSSAVIRFLMDTPSQEALHRGTQELLSLHLLRRTHTPPVGAGHQSEALVGAVSDVHSLLDNTELTERGLFVAQLPLPYQLGLFVFYGFLFHCVEDAVLVAAAMSMQSLFVIPRVQRPRCEANRSLTALPGRRLSGAGRSDGGDTSHLWPEWARTTSPWTKVTASAASLSGRVQESGKDEVEEQEGEEEGVGYDVEDEEWMPEERSGAASSGSLNRLENNRRRGLWEKDVEGLVGKEPDLLSAFRIALSGQRRLSQSAATAKGLFAHRLYPSSAAAAVPSSLSHCQPLTDDGGNSPESGAVKEERAEVEEEWHTPSEPLMYRNLMRQWYTSDTNMSRIRLQSSTFINITSQRSVDLLVSQCCSRLISLLSSPRATRSARDAGTFSLHLSPQQRAVTLSSLHRLQRAARSHAAFRTAPMPNLLPVSQWYPQEEVQHRLMTQLQLTERGVDRLFRDNGRVDVRSVDSNASRMHSVYHLGSSDERLLAAFTATFSHYTLSAECSSVHDDGGRNSSAASRGLRDGSSAAGTALSSNELEDRSEAIGTVESDSDSSKWKYTGLTVAQEALRRRFQRLLDCNASALHEDLAGVCTFDINVHTLSGHQASAADLQRGVEGGERKSKKADPFFSASGSHASSEFGAVTAEVLETALSPFLRCTNCAQVDVFRGGTAGIARFPSRRGEQGREVVGGSAANARATTITTTEAAGLEGEDEKALRVSPSAPSRLLLPVPLLTRGTSTINSCRSVVREGAAAELCDPLKMRRLPAWLALSPSLSILRLAPLGMSMFIASLASLQRIPVSLPTESPHSPLSITVSSTDNSTTASSTAIAVDSPPLRVNGGKRTAEDGGGATTDVRRRVYPSTSSALVFVVDGTEECGQEPHPSSHCTQQVEGNERDEEKEKEEDGKEGVGAKEKSRCGSKRNSKVRDRWRMKSRVGSRERRRVKKKNLREGTSAMAPRRGKRGNSTKWGKKMRFKRDRMPILSPPQRAQGQTAKRTRKVKSLRRGAERRAVAEKKTRKRTQSSNASVNENGVQRVTSQSPSLSSPVSASAVSRLHSAHGNTNGGSHSGNADVKAVRWRGLRRSGDGGASCSATYEWYELRRADAIALGYGPWFPAPFPSTSCATATTIINPVEKEDTAGGRESLRGSTNARQRECEDIPATSQAQGNREPRTVSATAASSTPSARIDALLSIGRVRYTGELRWECHLLSTAYSLSSSEQSHEEVVKGEGGCSPWYCPVCNVGAAAAGDTMEEHCRLLSHVGQLRFYVSRKVPLHLLLLLERHQIPAGVEGELSQPLAAPHSSTVPFPASSSRTSSTSSSSSSSRLHLQTLRLQRWTCRVSASSFVNAVQLISTPNYLRPWCLPQISHTQTTSGSRHKTLASPGAALPETSSCVEEEKLRMACEYWRNPLLSKGAATQTSFTVASNGVVPPIAIAGLLVSSSNPPPLFPTVTNLVARHVWMIDLTRGWEERKRAIAWHLLTRKRLLPGAQMETPVQPDNRGRMAVLSSSPPPGGTEGVDGSHAEKAVRALSTPCTPSLFLLVGWLCSASPRFPVAILTDGRHRFVYAVMLMVVTGNSSPHPQLWPKDEGEIGTSGELGQCLQCKSVFVLSEKVEVGVIASAVRRVRAGKPWAGVHLRDLSHFFTSSCGSNDNEMRASSAHGASRGSSVSGKLPVNGGKSVNGNEAARSVERGDVERSSCPRCDKRGERNTEGVGDEEDGDADALSTFHWCILTESCCRSTVTRYVQPEYQEEGRILKKNGEGDEGCDASSRLPTYILTPNSAAMVTLDVCILLVLCEYQYANIRTVDFRDFLQRLIVKVQLGLTHHTLSWKSKRQQVGSASPDTLPGGDCITAVTATTGSHATFGKCKDDENSAGDSDIDDVSTILIEYLSTRGQSLMEILRDVGCIFVQPTLRYPNQQQQQQRHAQTSHPLLPSRQHRFNVPSVLPSHLPSPQFGKVIVQSATTR